MVLIRRERGLPTWPEPTWPEMGWSHLGWPGLGLPGRWRRMLDMIGEQGDWLRVEEFRDGDVLVVRAELPGIDPDKDVEVTISDGSVRIRARREQRAEQKGQEDFRSEFRYGEIERDVPLPEGVTGEDIKASYRDGILEVRIPAPLRKEEKPTVMRVPVTKE